MKKLLLAFLAAMVISLAHGADKAKRPKVRIVTNMGTIEAVLYADKAPETVKNFLRYVDEGFYNGTVFHRVISSFMIQGGGFDTNLQKKPTHEPIRNEAGNGLKNKRGTLAMARTMDPHSATAQFFINVVDNPFLNYKSPKNGRTFGYAVFGKVTKGMKVVDKIRYVETGPGGPFPKDVPQQPVIIEKIERIQE